MIFGTSEIIRTPEINLAIAEKKIYRLGEVKSSVEKVAKSHLVTDKASALKFILPALDFLEAGSTEYTYFEIFTDTKGISRLCICHMQKMQ